MENNNKTVVELNKGLMKKTKVQLVELIFRKDEVEQNLQKRIKELNEDCSEYKELCEELEDRLAIEEAKYSKSSYDYCELCDEFATKSTLFNRKEVKYKTAIYVLLGIIGILAIIAI